MTVAVSLDDASRRPASVVHTLALPGLFERALVVLTTFVLIHQTPNAWFINKADVVEVSNPLVVVAELVLTGLAVARVVGHIDIFIEAFKLEPALFLFVGLTAASIFWSADPGESMRKSIVFVAVTFYATYLVIRFSLDQIIRMLALMFSVSAFLNIAFIAAFPQFGLDVDGRFTGVFGQKNAVGFVAALAIPTLLVAGRAWGMGRILFYPSALLHVGLLVGSESKTMLIAALAPTASMFLYKAFRARRTLRGAVLMTLSGSALFTVFFATANIELLARWLDKDVTLTGRVPLWRNLLAVAGERPLNGHGYGAAFGGYFSPIHEVWIQNQWNPSHAHNALLQIWLEIGVVGVVLYLVIYLRAVSRAIKIVAIVPGAVGLWPLVFLTTTLLVSITESGMSSSLIGWMMLVVAVLSVSLHLKHRTDMGLSNDVRELAVSSSPMVLERSS